MVSNMTLLVLGLMAMTVLISSNAEARELVEASSISRTASGVLAHLPNRSRWANEKCGKATIKISQAQMAPIGGIPTYTVEIANTCVSGRIISNVHVACGMFSSATLINPSTFRRLSYNDCLVNDGKPIPNGGIISFKYANTYSYPLSLSSVVCH